MDFPSYHLFTGPLSLSLTQNVAVQANTSYQKDHNEIKNVNFKGQVIFSKSQPNWNGTLRYGSNVSFILRVFHRKVLHLLNWCFSRPAGT